MRFIAGPALRAIVFPSTTSALMIPGTSPPVSLKMPDPSLSCIVFPRTMQPGQSPAMRSACRVDFEMSHPSTVTLAQFVRAIHLMPPFTVSPRSTQSCDSRADTDE